MTSSYTHTKLNDVKDSAPDFGYSDLQESRFAGGALDAEDTGVSLHRVRAGKRQGFAHKHDEAEEVYVVLEGSGRVKLDDDIVELERLDAVRVSPGVTRMFEAGPEGLEFIVFGPHYKGDGELIHDWWKD